MLIIAAATSVTVSAMTPRAVLASPGKSGRLNPKTLSAIANVTSTAPATKNGVSDLWCSSAASRACSAAARIVLIVRLMRPRPYSTRGTQRRPAHPRSGSRSPRPDRGSGCRARGARTGQRGGVERHERQLCDRLVGPKLDRHAREVCDLERERALPARIDEAWPSRARSARGDRGVLLWVGTYARVTRYRPSGRPTSMQRTGTLSVGWMLTIARPKLKRCVSFWRATLRGSRNTTLWGVNVTSYRLPTTRP